MASGTQNMTTYNARIVTGSNNAASPAGALLLSGAGRASNATGDTWIFLDSLGGLTNPWGIKHDQANNKLQIFGSGTNSVSVRMDTGDTYILGKVGIGYDPETSGNTYKLYVEGSTRINSTLHIFPNSANYTEGIRIHSYNSWSDITLCGNDNTGDTGISANSWFIGNNNGNFHITRNSSSGDGSAYLRCVNNVWAWNGTANGNISGNAATASKVLDSAHSWTATEIYNYMTARVLKAGDTITGTLVLSKNTDAAGTTANAVALVVGGAQTAQHIEIDGNEILSKSNGTTPGTLYLQDSTGTVSVAGSGGLAVSATTASSSKTTGALRVSGGAGFAGTVYANAFNGPLTGNVTGNCSGSSGSCTGNANTANYQNCVSTNEIRYARNGNMASANDLWQGWAFAEGKVAVINGWRFGNGNGGLAPIYGSKVYNAVWNDFAEYRESDENEGGRVLVSNGSGKLVRATERLQPAARVISDTFGCSVGMSDIAKTPIGVAGRVLVYPYQNRNNYKVGDAVCAAPNGTADIMTREEIIQYPDRIIGIVDEIPKYKIWQSAYTNTKNCDGTGEVGETNTTDIQVNGRIWIYVR